jgi:hypothetical protein
LAVPIGKTVNSAVKDAQFMRYPVNSVGGNHADSYFGEVETECNEAVVAIGHSK